MTRGGKRIAFWAVMTWVILGLGGGCTVASEKVPRMTIQQLKDLMGNPDVVILDVRSKSDWDKAQTKIQGAVREDPSKDTKSWAEKYGRDKTLVLYCA
ncbi:MAG: hypothetical protein HXY45_00180 [Syntrophaceae bacterium]|nr:hypothetical protein [Syntrophaceae bacterium]